MGTLRLSNGTTVTVPDDVTPDYLGQGLTAPGDEAQLTKTSKRRRGPRRPRTTASKPAEQNTPPAPSE